MKILTIIASLLLTVSLIHPSFAGVTTLAPPDIVDPSKTPGCPEFWVDIKVTDAVNLWGFMFTLTYDTSVLTAKEYKAHPIFYLPEPGEINDPAGYVSLAYHMAFGVPYGYTGSLNNLASIKFAVDDLGASQLDIVNSVFSDPVGKSLTHVTIGGSFRNVAGVPMANFVWAPEKPIEDELVTFTSTSTDPDGEIEDWAWTFGDSGSGSGETTTHRYRDAGTYTVTLTVMDNDLKTDELSKTITVAPAPLKKVGVRLQMAECTASLLDLSAYGFDQLNTFRALVKNLNQHEETLTRVALMVYDGDYNNLGAIELPWAWLKPNHPTWFTTDFNYAEWGYVGPEMEYIVITRVFYMDYYLYPGQPHWVETDRVATFNFFVTETAPVAVYTWTDNLDGSVTFDGSASYDPDEIWGDYIADITWRVYDRYPYYIASGTTITHTPDPDWADDIWQDEATGNWYADFRARIYVMDSLGATVWEQFVISVYLPGYTP